jgi:alpha-1,2-mannosyltransferase
MQDATSSIAELPSPRARIVRSLGIAAGVSIAVYVALIAALVGSGESVETAALSTGLSSTWTLPSAAGIDSWKPMAAAYEHERAEPGQMYWIFLVKHLRFQYPPSALLVMKLVPLPLTSEVRRSLARASLAAVATTIVLSVCILLLGSKPPQAASLRQSALHYASCTLLGLSLGITFYPLTRGHTLGQIQVYLDALIAAALLAHSLGRPVFSGACIGLCCLIKPHYAIVILWAGLRGQLRCFLSASFCVGAGLVFALREFGLKNHLDYLTVLRELSRHGESFWANQSVNGILHRLLGNGEAIDWVPRALPPYVDTIYFATTVSGLLIVGIALFSPTSRRWRGSALDLASVITGATLASPIAWEHHYGVLLPVYALALPRLITSARAGFWLLISYILVAVELVRPELVFANRATGLLGAHIFFGAISLFVILLWKRAAVVQSA